MKLMKPIFTIICTGALGLLTSHTIAEVSLQLNSVTQSFSGHFEPAQYIEFGLGYEPAPNISVSVGYSTISTEILNEKDHRFAASQPVKGVNADISQYYLVSQYGTQWCFKFCVKPYALAGLGIVEVEGAQPGSLVDSKGENTGDYIQYHAGTGVRYDINDNWSVQTEMRYIAWSMGDGIDRSAQNVDSIKASLGLQYRFGLPALSIEDLVYAVGGLVTGDSDDAQSADAKSASSTQQSTQAAHAARQVAIGSQLLWSEYPNYQSQEKAAGFEENQILVLSKSNEVATAAAASLEQQFPIELSDSYELKNLGYYISVFTAEEGQDIEQLSEQISKANSEWTTSGNSLLFPQSGATNATAQNKAQPEPRLYAQQMLAHSDWIKNHNPEAYSGVKIGAIDTAINPSVLPELRVSGSSVVTKSVLNTDDIPASSEHGTAIAQLLLGSVHQNGFMGIAPQSDLYWVNAMQEVDGEIRTNSLYIAKALDYLIGQGVDIINMSLGGEGDPVLKEIIEIALDKNITIVAAIGNNAENTTVYPAAYDGVWAVTAVDAATHRYNGAPQADYITLSAPGVQVWAPLPDDVGGRYFTGTSFATALATGSIAWQPSSFWNKSASERLEEICADAKPLAVPATGCGLVQLK